MDVKTFVSSGFNFADNEYELKLQHTLLNTILIAVTFLLVVLSATRFFEANFRQAAIDVVFVILSIMTIFYIRESKYHINRVTPFLLFIFFILVSYSFKYVGMHILGASWYIIFLIAVFFVVGMRMGLALSVASIVSFSILSFSGNVRYTAFEYIYILASVLMGILFIYLYEKRDSMIRELLYKRNDSLEEDIELKTQEQVKLLQKSHDLAQVIEKSSIELYIVDLETDHYVYVNQGATDALGYTKEEMLQKSIYDINPSLAVETVVKLKELYQSVPNIMNITEHQRKDGTKYGVQSYIHQISYDEKDAYVIYDIKISDDNRAKEEILRQQQSLTKQAYYDGLTALPNRALFYDRLARAITKSKRSHKEFALMFIDLDKFKEINDNLGHDIGDLVLIEIASRLKNSLREVDTVARLAGDEFLIIVEDIDSKEAIRHLVKNLSNELSRAIVVNDSNLYITSSIGISFYPDHTQDPKLLIKHADQAMYQAKSKGKNNFQFYNP